MNVAANNKDSVLVAVAVFAVALSAGCVNPQPMTPEQAYNRQLWLQNYRANDSSGCSRNN